MKRIVWLGAAVLFLGSTALAFSQGTMAKSSPALTEKKEAAEPQEEAMEQTEMSKGMGMHEKMAGMARMHEMMNKTMVATNDGGVIVMVGHKLMKYDKDLNLVKEAEIKIDWDKMKATCPMMNEKKNDMKMDKPESVQEKTEAPVASGGK